jgi:hypothetical protein
MNKSPQQSACTRWLLTCLLTAITVTGVAAAQTSIFSIQPSPSPSAAGNIVNGISGVASDDVWAVGFKNSSNLNEAQSLAMHWDGTAWKIVPSPNPGHCANGNFSTLLTSVSAIASNDVWAVGFSFGCNAEPAPLAMHWDGSNWRVVPTAKLPFLNNELNSVTAIASDDVYAVGFQTASNGATLTLVEHWDGHAWTLVSTPNGNTTGNVLSSVSATSANDVWAVGNQVAPNLPVLTLVLHFDGTKWSVVPSPNPLTSGSFSQNVLLSVHAVSPTDATSVGYILDGGSLVELTLIEHWDGASWTVVSSPNVSTAAGSFNRLTAVAAVSATDLYAAGFFVDSATRGQQETLVAHFDGAQWTIVPTPTKGLAQQLNAIFALPGTGNVWSGGAWSRNGTDPETGLLIIPRTLVLFSPIG